MGRLRLDGISVKLGGKPILHDISFSVDPGSTTTVVGPSGSGKTVLLKTIAGLIRPETGKIFLDDEDITSLPPDRRKMAMVFQNYALYPQMNARRNIAFPLSILNIPSNEINIKVERKAEEINGNLKKHLPEKPHELSEGHKQLTALARGTIREARILLLDEPLSQLDMQIHIKFRTDLKRYIRRLNITVLTVFSSVEDGFALGEQMIVLKDGRIEQIGTPSHIFHHPKNEFVFDFLSRYGMNIIEATFDGNDVHIGPIKIGYDKARFKSPEGKILVGIRPHSFDIIESGILGKITMIEPLNPNLFLLYVDTDIGELRVMEHGNKKRAIGDEMYLMPKCEECLFFDPYTRSSLESWKSAHPL
ncbi:MAG: ABC transporter ATP-binding protein [Thermotogae bacterium]|nr:ABC transporter ATP-binding protein [Thermotogota bacterium]